MMFRGIPHADPLSCTYFIIFTSAAMNSPISRQASSGAACRSLATLSNWPRRSASARKGRNSSTQGLSGAGGGSGQGAVLLNGGAGPFGEVGNVAKGDVVCSPGSGAGNGLGACAMAEHVARATNISESVERRSTWTASPISDPVAARQGQRLQSLREDVAVQAKMGQPAEKKRRHFGRNAPLTFVRYHAHQLARLRAIYLIRGQDAQICDDCRSSFAVGW